MVFTKSGHLWSVWCHYGWKGPLCDQCVTFPGCVYGSCDEPWQCVCDINWGGLLCDKDLNYCGTHPPCKNGGTCTNTEPNEFHCECREGFRGRNCDIVEHACLSSPCMNGAACVEDPTGFSCTCTDGWTGPTCVEAVRQCDRSPCGRGATCQEAPGGYRCLCPPGWTGRTCQLDTNECEMSICVHARSCRNLIGGYLCDCLPGWTGPNCDISEYERERKGTQEGRKDCPAAWTEVLDMCNPNPCPKGVPCHITEGRYLCACPEGYYGDECMNVKIPCNGQHCPGAVSDTTHGGVSFYIILVGVLALVIVVGCVTCAIFLSHLHRKRRKQQAVPQEEGINNQREFINLIRNVERPGPLLPSAAPPAPPAPPAHPQAPPTPVSRCYEEIELTLPPSPAPSHPSPALKRPCGPKLDISNQEREKLNRFHYTDNQDLEA
ncbi:Protein jagged-1 [Liparis tanakae]|uniref:Protein jagged-1 n=1 Tax=Liparis tanakae TaxID=230148 RepID=A0A4Z2IR19_9TELE|nr:Protein jagged-1 [Liparis tanakae]